MNGNYDTLPTFSSKLNWRITSRVVSIMSHFGNNKKLFYHHLMIYDKKGVPWLTKESDHFNLRRVNKNPSHNPPSFSSVNHSGLPTHSQQDRHHFPFPLPFLTTNTSCPTRVVTPVLWFTIYTVSSLGVRQGTPVWHLTHLSLYPPPLTSTPQVGPGLEFPVHKFRIVESEMELLLSLDLSRIVITIGKVFPWMY